MSYKVIVLVAVAAAFSSGDCCLSACLPQGCGAPLLPSPCAGLPWGVPGLSPLAWAGFSDCGPGPTPLGILQAAPVTTPTIDHGIVALPHPCIPAPRTIAHKCVCTKTVVKPQIIQRCISVPSVRHFVKKSYTPVIENIAYRARPICPQGPPKYAPCAPIRPPCAPAFPPCAPAFPPCARFC